MKKDVARELLREFWKTQRPPAVEPTLEERREKHRKSTYGVSQEDYKRLVHKQGGVCAICFGRETDVERGCLKPLVVDHCHATGVVRGLLCSPCNTMLGFSKDRPEVLRAAAEYLESGQFTDIRKRKLAEDAAEAFLEELRSL